MKRKRKQNALQVKEHMRNGRKGDSDGKRTHKGKGRRDENKIKKEEKLASGGGSKRREKKIKNEEREEREDRRMHETGKKRKQNCDGICIV